MKKRNPVARPGSGARPAGMAGCSNSSEAKITVINMSATEIKVAINSMSTTLAVGADGHHHHDLARAGQQWT